jgi:GT2 family glycosyltransferase
LRLKKFKDPRIEVIELKENIGICRACNIALKEANGEHLVIIASDDVMMPG